MKKINYLLLALILFLSACNTNTMTDPVDTSGTFGPEKGSLVIVGGAMRDTAIIDRFIELAGGKDAPKVIIPTASGAQEIDHERTSRLLTSRGATDVTVVHTYDPEEAKTEEFVAPIKRAMGLWFGGGRQWRIVDSYAGTISETEMRNVLERGGVIGGSSAGATIQGAYLARGDTKANTIMMGDHELGFDYLKMSAIDQHLLVRNRQNDLVEIISAHPELLGIGLDENTGVVVQGNEMEVIGKSFVAIYDYNLWDENPHSTHSLANSGKFFLLRSGDKYDVNTRKVTEWRGGNSRNIFPEPEQQE
jgi:cyanophycinase